jgi:CubicO group peptidase (beta-lactamase class C family)
MITPTMSLRSLHTAWLVLLSVLLAIAGLPVLSSPLDERLASVAERCEAPILKPGYGICLFDTQGEIWSRYTGLGNEETGVPFSRDTILRLGGSSEIFTVMLALQLVDAGLLDPEQPVAEYLPELFAVAAQGSSLERIGALKIRLLMSHLSGTGANFFLGFRDYDPFLNLRDYLKNVNLKYPPETKYLRSGAMIDLLGLAIERASGKSFEDLSRTALFEPLGMAASSFSYRNGPQLASLRYKSAGPDSYATRIPGFREAVVPSGSMQSSLKDLVAFYSVLLRMRSATTTRLVSRESSEAMFSSQSEAVWHRQGLRIGYAWKLSLPALAYLGEVAWCSGKHFSHRNVVILLPGLGVGVVCATNAWSIFEGETILPMAIEILATYARDELKIAEPPAVIPARAPLSQRLRAQVGGLYASPSGVYRLRSGPGGLVLSSRTMEITLQHGAENDFHPGPDEVFAKITFTPPGSLSLHMRNGMVVEAQRVRPSANGRLWLQRQGTYRLAQPHPGALFAFTLGAFQGLPVITGDDGVELLLEPATGDHATIRCDETSRFFGQELQVSGDQELLLQGIPYQRVR